MIETGASHDAACGASHTSCAQRLARLLPWILLWVIAPFPLWLALAMARFMGH